MPAKLNIPLPSKGLAVDLPAEYVDSRSATAIKNMEFNRGIIRKRVGKLAMGATMGERVMSLFELEVNSILRLFRIGTSAVEVYNKTTDVWASATTTPLTGSVSDIISYGFPILSGAKIAVFTNGIDNIRKCSITGNDADLGGTPPKAKFLIPYGSYLILAYITDGGNTYDNRVQWCDTGDPENWTTGNAGSANLLEDSEEITGVGLFGNLLTIHKPNSIYVGQLVTSSDVFRFERRATGSGTVANATIASIPSGEQIFLGSDGIHLFNGVTAPLIESPVQEEIRESINPEFRYKSQAVVVKELDEYWVCVPIGSDSEPQTIYKYNYRTRQCYKDIFSNLTAMGSYLNKSTLTWADMTMTWSATTLRWDSSSTLSNNPLIIFGDSTGITTKRSATTNNDNSVAVDALFETKEFTCSDFGLQDMDVMMRWKYLELWALGNTVSVYYSTDGGTTFALAGKLTLSSSYPPDDSPLVLYFDVVGSRFKLRFKNDVSGETFTIKKYILGATKREARK